VFKSVFWQRKDNRVLNHVVLLTPVKWRSQEASFPDEKMRKKSFPEINALTFKMASYDVTICISWETRGNFRTKSPSWNTYAFYPCFILLGLGDRIAKWHFFGSKIASPGEALLFAVPTTTVRNCRKQLPIFLSYLLERYSLSRLKPTNSQLGMKMMS